MAAHATELRCGMQAKPLRSTITFKLVRRSAILWMVLRETLKRIILVTLELIFILLSKGRLQTKRSNSLGFKDDHQYYH